MKFIGVEELRGPQVGICEITRLIYYSVSLVDKAAHDFSETETMLQKAEELCGPYVWGIYDILVLPPSFPYGGMENPCLTFATPTLLVTNTSNTSS